MPGILKTACVLFTLLLIACSSIRAQKVVRGTVADAQTGATLPATNILIDGTYRGTITNENGSYSLTIPDSLLPATLIVRYIGYESQNRIITQHSAAQQDFTLQPAVTEMEEIVVTDENPGVRIMREVIRRKQLWRRRLNTYRADAYTRQTLANDTSIVSITESVSEVLWDEEQGHREVLKSKRQTANLQSDQNFAGVSYMPNFYDDNIDIAGFKLVGVTHPDALKFYDFELIDQTSLDNRLVYKIRVTPDRKLQPLFEGTVFVLADAYALLEVNLRPNDVVRFPQPVKSFTATYRQQFNNFSKDFWLPVDMRIGGDVKISMLGLKFPLIKFKQVSRITNYSINVPLPDSLYEQEDRFSVDSATVASDSLVSLQAAAVPLSIKEQQAYETLDSTETLEKAFKPSGFLARFLDDEDDEDKEGSSPESGPGSGFFDVLKEVPGSFSPQLRYNRVDELFAGINYRLSPTSGLELRANGGYSTGYADWNYGGGLTLNWLKEGKLESSLGWDYVARTELQYDSPIYHTYYASITNLLGNKGYFDYLRSEGFRAFSRWSLPDHELSLEVGFNSQDQSSLSTTTSYDVFGVADNFRINPPVEEGLLRSIDITAGYKLEEGYNLGITGQKQLGFSIEHSSGAFGSDFDYTRYEGKVSWVFPTFYQRRLMPNMLYLNLKAGTYSGELPPQKAGIIDVALGPTAPFGVMRAARNRPYEGRQYLSFNLEHNFRTIPFEILGLQSLVERNIGFIAFAGAARTWPDRNDSPPAGFAPNGTDGLHLEAGASLNGIFSLFRLDFAARLDEPAFLINIGVARLF